MTGDDVMYILLVKSLQIKVGVFMMNVQPFPRPYIKLPCQVTMCLLGSAAGEGSDGLEHTLSLIMAFIVSL